MFEMFWDGMVIYSQSLIATMDRKEAVALAEPSADKEETNSSWLLAMWQIATYFRAPIRCNSIIHDQLFMS